MLADQLPPEYSDAAAELRRLYSELQKLKPKEKLVINVIQFDALARLKRLRPETPTCAAVRSVMIDGVSMYAAAKAQGISQTAVQRTVDTLRAAIRDCYSVVTGEEPGV
ncbi:MAG: hypothetical protein RR326_02965 [Stenotrophomonas sp.]